MPLVFKEDMFGEIVNLPPGCWGSGVKIPMLLFYLRMIGNDMPMAVQAFFHRRNPRMGGSIHIGVAKPALDLFYAGMNPVAESNRLCRSEAGFRKPIK
jgi:hypothetical protein